MAKSPKPWKQLPQLQIQMFTDTKKNESVFNLLFLAIFCLGVGAIIENGADKSNLWPKRRSNFLLKLVDGMW